MRYTIRVHNRLPEVSRITGLRYGRLERTEVDGRVTLHTYGHPEFATYDLRPGLYEIFYDGYRYYVVVYGEDGVIGISRNCAEKIAREMTEGGTDALDAYWRVRASRTSHLPSLI
ncbi:MAG: hypothetical protein QXI19_07580 [Candidatus Caldarchaeum sp.]